MIDSIQNNNRFIMTDGFCIVTLGFRWCDFLSESKYQYWNILSTDDLFMFLKLRISLKGVEFWIARWIWNEYDNSAGSTLGKWFSAIFLDQQTRWNVCLKSEGK
jgi:hypothetical protein